MLFGPSPCIITVLKAGLSASCGWQVAEFVMRRLEQMLVDGGTTVEAVRAALAERSADPCLAAQTARDLQVCLASLLPSPTVLGVAQCILPACDDMVLTRRHTCASSVSVLRRHSLAAPHPSSAARNSAQVELDAGEGALLQRVMTSLARAVRLARSKADQAGAGVDAALFEQAEEEALHRAVQDVRTQVAGNTGCW